jgi:hypothetical protein
LSYFTDISTIANEHFSLQKSVSIDRIAEMHKNKNDAARCNVVSAAKHGNQKPITQEALGCRPAGRRLPQPAASPGLGLQRFLQMPCQPCDARNTAGFAMGTLQQRRKTARFRRSADKMVGTTDGFP